MTAREAFLIAVAAHQGAVDKGGEPYIFHPIAVAEAVQGLGEDYEVVAFLHDVIEDTDQAIGIEEGGWISRSGPTPSVLSGPKLSAEQAAALLAITKDEKETYAAYVRRVRENFIARVVKIADLKHNLSPERQGAFDEKTRASLAMRYGKALAHLEGND